MAVNFYIDWANGSIASQVYTSNTPDIPDAFAIDVTDSNVEVEAAAPWNGQTLLDVSNAWADGASATLTSAEITATQGRMLIEFEPWIEEGASERVVLITATTNSNFHLEAKRLNGSPDYLYLSLSWNGWASYSEINFGAFPSNPFALEIIWDTNNGTGSQRFRARYWDIGSSAGAFTDGAPSGSAATTDQPTAMNLARRNGALITTRIGKIVISDDITEDLSSWSPGGGDAPALMGAMCL